MQELKGVTIFEPSSGLQKGSAPNLVGTGFERKIPFYVFPPNMTIQHREYMTFYLAGLGTSEEPRLEAWKSWIVTYVSIVTPPIAKMLNTKMFQPIMVSSPKILSLVEIFERVEKAIEDDNLTLAGQITAELEELVVFEGLPAMKKGLNLATANGEWTTKVIVSHYAIMLFLAGKRMSGDNHSQITVARPKALKGKAHLEGSIELLEGTFRMSDEAHVKINDAWSEMGSLRAVVFTEYARYEATTASEVQNLIWTTMHLLRFSGMSHAAIVFNFLQVCPWVYEVPTLRPALATYIRSVVASSKVDQKIFPYLKLIQGDKSDFFKRSELEPLIACAVSVLTETNPTLAAFYTKPEFAPIVEAFTVLREEKEKTGAPKVELTPPSKSFEENEEDEESDAEDVE